MGTLSDKWGRKPLLLACCIAFIMLPYPAFSFLISPRIGDAAHPGADRVRDPDLVLLGRRPGGDRRDVPDAHALDLDDVGLRACGRDLRRLRTARSRCYLIDKFASPLAHTFYLIAAAIVSTIVIAMMRETAHEPLG